MFSGIAICVGSIKRGISTSRQRSWMTPWDCPEAHHIQQPDSMDGHWKFQPSNSSTNGLRVDANAHAHGGGNSHFAQVQTFAGGWLGFVQCVDQRGQVALQLVGIE
jgi:hypothetical protein